MTTHGFYFSRLEVRGRKKQTAVIDFDKGLNVISGASDTGKSYLVQCLDYMTGATTPPEAIDEAKGYENLWLQIVTWKKATFTLERSLQGGDFRLYNKRIDEIGDEDDGEILKEKNRTKTLRTISDFLLEICNLADKTLLAKKKDGTTWTLKFRAVAHLTIIDEERIYTRGSPIHASQVVTQKTLEESLFRYLITGVDDTSLVSAPSHSRTDSLRKARYDTLVELIESTESDLAELTDSPDEVNSQIQKLERALDDVTTTIAVDRKELIRRQKQRQSLWGTIESASSRNEVLGRLTDRFSLLKEYYASDLRRLGAMSEAGGYLAQLPLTDCPLCGTETPWGTDDDITSLNTACSRESERIRMLQTDLESTINDINLEMGNLDREAARAQRSYERIANQIDNELLPSNKVRKKELTELLDAQARLGRASALIDQLNRMRSQLQETEKPEVETRAVASKQPDRSRPKTSETSSFCEVVEKLLRQWKFPDSGRVSFSEGKQDLVINHKDRSSHGKGIRALSHAAFIVALLRYCRKEKRPHPGHVVLDSPLVAYREPDSMKAVEKSRVKDCFYQSLAKYPSKQQILVFENEDPPDSLTKKINYIHFSGDKEGESRSGFFPA